MFRAPTRRSSVAISAVAALVMLVGKPWPPELPAGPSDLDLLASAHSTEAEPALTDYVTDLGRRSYAIKVKSDTAAVATSVDCPGCAAEAGTVNVVTAVHALTVRADNVSIATASCDDCDSSAISVQVVFARSNSKTVATNRAQATTVTCARCTSTAGAVQLVVLGGGATLSPATEAELERVTDTAERQLDELARVKQPDATSQKALDAFADDVTGVVEKRTGGTVERRAVALDTDRA